MEGALIEPLSVGFHAANQGEVQVGDTCVILGGGCIGIMTMLSCKAHGAGKIIVSDLVEARLEKAKALGADYVLNGANCDVPEEVMKLTDGKGADKVFETARSPCYDWTDSIFGKTRRDCYFSRYFCKTRNQL